ncbi:DUF3553 domain-containing protein [Rhodobacteraceae bacterium NNCM2]|nr:DUF3553 domain-containing protein [Coraliihabitans acroporae]
MLIMSFLLEPGTLVRHPDCADWGVGQVQSITGNKATVNFEEVGKVVLLLDAVSLEIVAGDTY